jgi:hypothetical protein
MMTNDFSSVGPFVEAVSDVSVTDGVPKARVISFFNRDGKIVRTIEFLAGQFPLSLPKISSAL